MTEATKDQVVDVTTDKRTIYEEAVELLRAGHPVDGLCRRLGIGQIVAADVFERLEREGIVSKPGKGGARQMLL